MAGPTQLIATIHKATGVPLPTIVDIDRRLVQGGLRSKSGRGLSAAKMSLLDAARLLTAILVNPQANAVLDAIGRYERTRPTSLPEGEPAFGSTGLVELVALPANHSFVAAVTAVIASASYGSLAAAAKRMGTPPHLELFALTNATRGHIRIAGLPNRRTASVDYSAARAQSSKAAGGSPAGDLEQSRRVTEVTIFQIAELLGKETPHE